MLWRVEFHAHTCYSPDSLLTPEKLLATCRRRGIDKIAITDHNTLRGALEAYALDPHRVIIGEEILTTRGELLAFFVKEEIPAGLSPQETIQRLREQDAFISVSHPFDRLRKGHWAFPDLLEILPLVDAIEGFNARCLDPRCNAQAIHLAREKGLPITAGSDAHSAMEVGRASLFLPAFGSAEELRQVLPQAELQARLSPPWVHLFSRYATWRKRLRRSGV
ncbi:MAG: PHP-associated domain-containing protein [Anaerolineales bacterium]